MKMYKIRDKDTGKFSPGGKYWYAVEDHFTKDGELFSKEGVQEYTKCPPWVDPQRFLVNCEIVEFEVKESGTKTLAQVRAAARKRHAAEQKREDRRIAAEQIRIFGETF